MDNAIRAVQERVILTKTGGPPHRPAPKYFEEVMRKTRARLLKKRNYVQPMSPDEFLETYRGQPMKLKRYEAAREKCQGVGMSRREAFVKSFTKSEWVDFSSKPDPAPRLIQPRSYTYNYRLGRFIKALEKPVYKQIAKMYGETTVAKGLNARQRGRLIAKKWGKFRRPVAVGIDATRFDQHCCVDALMWEHSIYVEMIAGSDNKTELNNLLQYQNSTRGRIYFKDGVIKYSQQGGRCSGDMNTSLGNCTIMSSAVFAYLSEKEMEFSFVNDGDDGVIFMEEEDLHHLHDLKQWFYEIGFDMKIEKPVNELEHVEFCQCKPVFEGDGYLMVRNPSRALKKDSLTTKDISSEKAWDYHRNAIASCGLALAGHMPVMSEFYQALKRGIHTKIRNATGLDGGMYYLARGMEARFSEGKIGGTYVASSNRPDTEVESLVRWSFYRAFDISLTEQLNLENYYRGVIPIYQPSFTGMIEDQQEAILIN